jgi:hypothetical protein
MNKEKELARYAKGKLKQYHLKGWNFIITDNLQESDRASCNYDRKIITVEKFATDRFKPETLQDIFLHELGHAIAGYEAFHGKDFKKVCRQIGCKGMNAINDVLMFELTGYYKPTSQQFMNAMNEIKVKFPLVTNGY